MKIEKKCDKEFFQKILDGKKTFELRLADWECNEGDTLVLMEIYPETRELTGRTIEKKVGVILKTKDYTSFSKEDVEKYGFQVISLL